MLASFTRHPRSVGESYGEHMGMAWSFGFTLIGDGVRNLWNPDAAAQQAAVEYGKVIAKA